MQPIKSKYVVDLQGWGLLGLKGMKDRLSVLHQLLPAVRYVSSSAGAEPTASTVGLRSLFGLNSIEKRLNKRDAY